MAEPPEPEYWEQREASLMGFETHSEQRKREKRTFSMDKSKIWRLKRGWKGFERLKRG